MARPFEHARGQVEEDHLAALVALGQGRAQLAGAGPDVDDGARLQLDQIEPFQQAAADLALQDGDFVIRGRGAVEGVAHQAFVELIKRIVHIFVC